MKDGVTDLAPPASSGDQDDRKALATLQVQVALRGPRSPIPELSSALQLFRRAANVLARLEDLVVFRGLADGPTPGGEVLSAPRGAPCCPAGAGNWKITGGRRPTGC